jgi:dTDP-4-dehydrorhamnose 3,5-epimerase
MNLIKTKIKDCYLIKLDKFNDERGFFSRAFCKKVFVKKKILNNIRQINFSFSKKKGTIRGLHYQKKPFQEMKIIYCIKGEIYDVIVDLRKKSKTYKKYLGFKISADDRKGIIVPKGCAHGFQTLKSNSEVVYFTTEYYNKEKETGLNFLDSSIKIRWPLKVSKISEKDLNLPKL